MCLFWHFGPMPGKAEIFANALYEWLRKLWFGRTNPPWVVIGKNVSLIRCLPELPLTDTYWSQHVEGWSREQMGMNFCSPHCRCVLVIGSEELKFLSSQVILTSLVSVFRPLSQLRSQPCASQQHTQYPVVPIIRGTIELNFRSVILVNTVLPSHPLLGWLFLIFSSFVEV